MGTQHHRDSSALLRVGVIVVVVVVCALNLTATAAAAANDDKKTGKNVTTNLNPAIKKVCDATTNPDVCAHTIAPYQSGKTDLASVLTMQLNALTHGIGEAITKAKAKRRDTDKGDEILTGKIDGCIHVYENAIYEVKQALQGIQEGQPFNVKNALTAVASDISTCEDGFTNDGMEESNHFLTQTDLHLKKMNTNALDIMAVIDPPKNY